MNSMTIAMTSTFTAEPIEQALNFWINELDISAQIKFAPYNQVHQQLVDPAGIIGTNANGINVVLLRFEDWVTTLDAGASEVIEAAAADFLRGIEAAGKKASVPFLVILCPGSEAFLSKTEHLNLSEKLTVQLAQAIGEMTGVYFVDPSEIFRLYPVQDYRDSHSDEHGKIPYTPTFFAVLATVIARKLCAIATPPHKVLVLDCDQTLWTGVCSEVGPMGVEIHEHRKTLQEFALAQRDAGVLLCLCSKNSEEDVFEVFDKRPEMSLKRDHLTSWKINWDAKSQNIKAMAHELKLGLDSFVFLDDDDVQIAEVRNRCPEVLALQLPRDITQMKKFLNHVWQFDRLRVTNEDRRRALLYKQGMQRETARNTSLSLEDFLAELKLEIRILPMSKAQLSRISQLTQRTNQFNFTTLRRTEAEIRRLTVLDGFDCLTVEVSDRFGDYGLVGVMIFKAADIFKIDTMLLSCRALGRRVEHAMLAKLIDIARTRGYDFIQVPFFATKKNKPALDFLESVAEPHKQAIGTELLFIFPVDNTARISSVKEKVPPAFIQLGTPSRSDPKITSR